MLWLGGVLVVCVVCVCGCVLVMASDWYRLLRAWMFGGSKLRNDNVWRIPPFEMFWLRGDGGGVVLLFVVVVVAGSKVRNDDVWRVPPLTHDHVNVHVNAQVNVNVNAMIMFM